MIQRTHVKAMKLGTGMEVDSKARDENVPSKLRLVVNHRVVPLEEADVGNIR